MNNEISWADEIGSKIIKEVKVEISHPVAFITLTQKICVKCNQKFTYERKIDLNI